MENINKDTTNDTSKYQVIFTGLFWIYCGIVLLINNFSAFSSNMSLVLILLSSIYLILFSMLKLMRRIYFVIGVIVLAIFINLFIERISSNSLLWPIIMLMMSLGILGYGMIFKRTSLIAYLVPGAVLLIISILVWLTIMGVFRLSDFLLKSWPLAIVFLGVHAIYSRFSQNNTSKEKESKRNNKKDKQPEPTIEDKDN